MAFLAPSSQGWRVRAADGSASRAQEAATFAEAVALAFPHPSGQAVSVALPARLAIFERFTFPSSDPGELSGMVRLQLEKTLPYPIEETTHRFQRLPAPPARPDFSREAAEEAATTATTLEETTVIVCAVHNAAVEAFCAPLLQRRRFPGRLTLWAMHVAAQAPPAGCVCAFWREEASVIFGIFESGTLSFCEVMASRERCLDDLPQVLMSAELAGAPTEFCAVLLDPALDDFRQPMAEFLAASVEPLLLDELPVEGPVDLIPDEWRAELARQERARKLKKRLAVAGLVYAALLLLGFAYLGVLGNRLRGVEKELATVRPQVDDLLARQSRWRQLAAATDPDRFTVEQLYQVFRSLPSPDVRITQFDESPTQLMLEGEAPDASQAVELGEKLKAQPGLNGFSFETGQPTLLPNDHAQFRIFGKR